MLASPVRQHLKVIGLIGLLLLAVACGSEEEPTPAPTDEPTAVAEVEEPTNTPEPSATPLPPTNTPEPTTEPTQTPSPTPEPTDEPTAEPSPTPSPTLPPTPTVEPDVAFQGVSFIYVDPLPAYNRAVAEKVAAAPRSPAVGVDRGNPDYLRFYFGDAAPLLEFLQPREPQILVYPVADYIELFPEAAEQVDALAALLDDKPAAVEEPLPFLPLIGAEETFHAQLSYLGFQNGEGVRYVTQRDQFPGPVTNESIFYTFQGLTDDGQYYVAAFFPLEVEGLPATFSDADLSVFQSEDILASYYESTVAELDSLPAQGFSLDLGNLDVVMQSISAAPADLAAAPVAAEVNTAPVASTVEAGEDAAVLSGAINYPVGDGSLLKIYAIDAENPAVFYFLETFELSYALPVAPGDYYVVAYAAETLLPGGYTQRVICRAAAADAETFCGDQSLVLVQATAGETVSDIDINDWDIPDDVDFPSPPDGATAAGVPAAGETTGQVFGSIDYFTSPVPPLRVYAQEINTQAYYTTDMAANEPQYILDLPNGTYRIFAYTLDGTTAGGYTEGDSALRTIVISGTTTLTNIEIGNFNTPPLDLIPPQPDATTAAPTGSSTVTTTQTVTPTEGITIGEGLGQIQGALSAPQGDAVPALTIYVQGLTNSQLYTLNLEAGFGSYFIEVATGQYVITAVTADGQFYGGYTEASLCADPSACTDHTLRVVTIAQNGDTFNTADITDWNVPPEVVPN